MRRQTEEERRREEQERMANRPMHQISIQELLGVPVPQTSASQTTESGGGPWQKKEPQGTSLLEIQKEEERQMRAEQMEMAEMEAVKRSTAEAMNIQSNTVWGKNVAKTINWASVGARSPPKAPSPHPSGGQTPSGPWGAARQHNSDNSSCPLMSSQNSIPKNTQSVWGDADSLPQLASTNQEPPSLRGGSGGGGKKAKGGKGTSSQKEKAPKKNNEAAGVQRVFAQQIGGEGELIDWMVAQIRRLNSGIDAFTLAAFLKDIESPHEVEDYVISYFGDCAEARTFMQTFLEKRCEIKSSKTKSTQRDDLATPAPALAAESAGVGAPQPPGAGGPQGVRKKKKGKGQKVLDGSILGFRAAADPNRVNVGDIDLGD